MQTHGLTIRWPNKQTYLTAHRQTKTKAEQKCGQTTLARKKQSQELFFKYSDSFSPAEYGYESQFFPSRPDFPKS